MKRLFFLRIAIARRILFAVTFDVVIRIGSMPLAENTSASLILAAQMPIEPPASCSFATAGHLCDLPCGRLATCIAVSLVRMVAMFCSNVSRSTQSAGVSSSHFDTPVSVPSSALARISAAEKPRAEPAQTAAPPVVMRKLRRDMSDRDGMACPPSACAV